MTKKYVFVRIPKEVHLNLINGKKKLENDIEKSIGKRTPLTMPKYLNVLQKSREGFLGLIPYNIPAVTKLAKKGRGYYE